MLFDKDRNLLLGGVEDVTLGASEARARPDGRKQVMMRKGKVVFQSAVEMRGFSDWIVHRDLERTVGLALDGRCFPAHWHRLDAGELEVTPVVGRLTRGGDTFEYFTVDAGDVRPAFEFSSTATDTLGVPLWVPREDTVGVYVQWT